MAMQSKTTHVGKLILACPPRCVQHCVLGDSSHILGVEPKELGKNAPGHVISFLLDM